MFYEPGKGHGLPHDPFKAIVAPRPIGWISTRGKDGSVNLAPYSFFNAVCGNPPIVMFSSDGEKDSVTFAREMGGFVCNFAGESQVEAMNATSAAIPRGHSEFDHAGLSMIEANLIDAPRVAGAPAALECKVTNITRLKDMNGNDTGSWTVFGQVIGIHIDEAFLTDGRFDLAKAKPVTRLGYMDFAVTKELFQMKRPG